MDVIDLDGPKAIDLSRYFLTFLYAELGFGDPGERVVI